MWTKNVQVSRIRFKSVRQKTLQQIIKHIFRLSTVSSSDRQKLTKKLQTFSLTMF